jgi:hypothetical protein
MSIQESSATALVRFTGLGIICFNDARRRGEIGVIRDNKHLLSIKIQQPVFQEGAGSDLVVYQDIATYENLPKEDVRIEINASDSPAIAGYEIYQSGDFDRLGDADPNDFRWLVNMNALHGDAPLAPAEGERYPLTKIYVGNGLFYTHKLDHNLLFEKVEKGSAGTTGEPETFGNVGETLGVKIEGAAVTFTIHIGDQKETHTLKRVEGLPFRIEIKNMDYSDNAVYSDMEDYYRYLASPDGSKFDFKPVLEDAGEGGAVNQQDFCHPIVTGGITSIDEL